MSEYPWNKKNNTFTWLSSLYNPFNVIRTHKAAMAFHTRLIKKFIRSLLKFPATWSSSKLKYYKTRIYYLIIVGMFNFETLDAWRTLQKQEKFS